MPGTTMSTFWYVYVLESLVTDWRYVGFTNDLRTRLQNHNSGRTPSTKPYLPVKIIYFEACLNKIDASRRERYLKTSGGRKFLSKRLIEHYKSKHKMSTL